MKALVWTLTAVLAAVWSAAVAAAHALFDWAGRAVAGADTQVMAAHMQDWPLPGWLAVWLDPQWLEGWRETLAALGTGLVASQPWIVSALDWLGPLMWGVWGLGMVLLLGLALVTHLVLGWLRAQHGMPGPSQRALA